MAKVVYDDVTKQFDSVVALKELELEVEDGEFLVLVGPSGCGKSTALRCLAGLEEISKGDILIGDRVVTQVPPKDRDIAMVFQSYALYPHMSVRDNLAFGLKLRKTPKDAIKKRVEEAAEMLGLEGLLDRKPKQLSGGQRQRVALGRAIVREPQVFLMDEPLSNLDAKLRVQTRAEIIKLQKRLDTTTIYVTHDQVEAMTMGDRIAVMNHGLLQQLDTPQEIYDKPANLFVATFIGSPAMNIFKANVERGDGGLKVVADGLALDVPSSRAKGLEGHVGREVHVGIRPEYFAMPGTPEATEQTQWSQAKLPVELVESLGSETLVHLTGPDGVTMVARVDPHVVMHRGDVVDILIDVGQIHAFDPDTEKALA